MTLFLFFFFSSSTKFKNKICSLLSLMQCSDVEFLWSSEMFVQVFAQSWESGRLYPGETTLGTFRTQKMAGYASIDFFSPRNRLEQNEQSLLSLFPKLISLLLLFSTILFLSSFLFLRTRLLKSTAACSTISLFSSSLISHFCTSPHFQFA